MSDKLQFVASWVRSIGRKRTVAGKRRRRAGLSVHSRVRTARDIFQVEKGGLPQLSSLLILESAAGVNHPFLPENSCLAL